MSATATTKLHPDVVKFLSSGTLQGVVGGKDVASSTGQTMKTLNPGSGEVLAEFAALGESDVDHAVHVAAETFNKTPWAKLPPNERGVWLHRLADAVEKHKPIIGQIESLDAGKILPQALGDVQNFVDTLRYFTNMSLHVQHRTALAVSGHDAWTVRHPWGPCGFIFPWNFPFLLIGWGISPALAAGEYRGDQAGRGYPVVRDLPRQTCAGDRFSRRRNQCCPRFW